MVRRSLLHKKGTHMAKEGREQNTTDKRPSGDGKSVEGTK